MKLAIATFIALISLGQTATASSPKNESTEPWDIQPMSMYIEQGCLRDSDYVSRINFENFDNVYMMDRAFWKSQEHFDSTIDAIAASDGQGYRFTKDNLFAYAVKCAHDAGTTILFTGCNDMHYGALDDAKRQKMVKTMIDVVRKYDFDGIDIDWEIGIYQHMDKHAALLSELRDGLDKLGAQNGRKYYLTTALSVEAQYPDSLHGQLKDAVDWINIMSYDVGGCLWRDHATHNTGLDVIKESMKKRWSFMPPEKLHLGLASYGFIYWDILPGEKLPAGEKLSDHGRYAIYNELLPQIYSSRPWKEVYDDAAKCSYFINPDKKEFITVDTPQSIRQKFEYVKEAGLGGTFWWEYCKDIVADPNGGYKWKHILVPDHKRNK